MRDPKRIPELFGLLSRIWNRDPDLRFNQLIYNLHRGYSHKYDSVGQVKGIEADGFERIGFDLFNLEDTEFIEYLRHVAVNEFK